MKLLCVDSSSSAGSIVLSEDSIILGEVNLDSARTHTARLLVGIQYLLTHAELNLSDIDVFGVTHGPGSFTGLRIGLTTIKGLAETFSKPTVAVTTFEAWSEKCPEWQGILVPLIDARRGEVYASVFERTGTGLQQRGRGFVDSPGTILSNLDEEEVLFLGDGALKYHDAIYSQNHPKWKIIETDRFLGRSLTKIVSSRANQRLWIPAMALQAYYVRQSDAEIKWNVG